jgi:medium-chain acyl-[acyl-carrier-protein] hydrolase
MDDRHQLKELSHSEVARQSVGIWAEDHLVRAYEVDCRGSLSAVSLCNFMQEAAANHALALGVSIHQILPQNITWIFSRLALRVYSHPGWGEPLRVKTWPSGVRGPFALRDFLMTGKDERPVAAAVSAWLLIDTRTRLPLRRVTSVLDRLGTVKAEPPLAHDLRKLPALDGYNHEARFPVRYHDLDVNNHVNNVSYIGWVVESLPHETLDGVVLTDLEVNYIAEAFAGDQVLARSLKIKENPLSFCHSIVREGDGLELLRARTAWNFRDLKSP